MIINIIIAILIFVHIFFVIAVLRKNFAVIDIGWGLGILLISVVSYCHNEPILKNVIILTLVVLWALRLSSYIFVRGSGKGEDPRYTKFRKSWEPHANFQAWIKVFLFQGILMMIVSLPVSAGMSANSKMTLLNWLGVLIWFAGFSLEVWSDHYLNVWKGRPENKGRICTTGPWKLCRFPNYFGEVLLWYGIYFVGFDLTTSWAIVGAIVINVFILKVTGVPLLEEKYLKRSDYQDYARRVPRFIPFSNP